MNRVEKALFELRADMARNTESLEAIELDYLLACIEAEADQSLVAVVELFRFDMETLEERAAIIQHDSGKTRTAACRLAATLALQEREPELSDRAARWVFDHAAAILNWEKSTGATRQQTVQAMRGCMMPRGGESRTTPFSSMNRAAI